MRRQVGRGCSGQGRLASVFLRLGCIDVDGENKNLCSFDDGLAVTPTIVHSAPGLCRRSPCNKLVRAPPSHSTRQLQVAFSLCYMHLRRVCQCISHGTFQTQSRISLLVAFREDAARALGSPQVPHIHRLLVQVASFTQSSVARRFAGDLFLPYRNQQSPRSWRSNHPFRPNCQVSVCFDEREVWETTCCARRCGQRRTSWERCSRPARLGLVRGSTA